jgi:alkyl sulfatase BDS1-like metallo-beta-lactamase superfamily hydrolase
MSDSIEKNRKLGLDLLNTALGAPAATQVTNSCYAISNIFGTIGFIVTGDGVVVIDAGVDEKTAEAALGVIRNVTGDPIKYLVYTHGHADHVKGAPVFKREGAVIVAHKNVAPRFDRYTAFNGYHERINGIQFAKDSFERDRYWSEFVYPDVEYSDSYTMELGGKTFLLSHEKGETDDATTVKVLADNVVYVGDFLIWAFPNIGNPNKVVRYEKEWFEALDRIAAEKPDHIVPGHGRVLSGGEALQALADTSAALRILYEQAKKFINEGRNLDDIIENAILPQQLAESPYIPEVYGTREFVLRGIHRRYTGWYDGNPSNLNPAPKTAQAKAVFELIGDREKIIRKAKETEQLGDLRLSLHIIDLALDGNPQDTEAAAYKSELLQKLGAASNNLFYRNFYLHEAERYAKKGKGGGLV